MELVFIKEGNEWVAEFEATADFNLHIEREHISGNIELYQRTVPNGSYALVNGFRVESMGKKVIDADVVGGVVWPKYIRVESKDEPTYAEVTFRA